MKSLKRNIIYNTGYQLLVIVIPLITSPYLSRILGTDGVGVYSYTYSVANYFVLFAMLGLSNYGNRSIASCGTDLEKRNKTFSSIYAMQFLWASLVFIVYLLYISFADTRYHTIALIQMIYVFSAVLDVNWFYFGIEEFKLTVVRNMMVKIITLICIFAFVKTQDDVWKYAIIMSAGTLIGQSWVWIYLRKYVKIVKVSFKEIIAHIKPNFVLFIPVISYSIYKIMDKIMLGNLVSMSAVGIYEYAEKIINIPLGFISAFGTVMLPRISNLIASDNGTQAKKYMSESAKYITAISCAMAFGLMSVGDVFAPLYYGDDFTQSGEIIVLLSITLIFVSWANIIRTQYLIPYKKDSIYLVSTIVGAVLNLIINLSLIPMYGVYGAAIGTIVAEASVFVTQVVGTRKQINYLSLAKEAVPFVAIGCIMWLCLLRIKKLMPVSWMTLLLLVFFGAVIYVSLSVVFLTIADRDGLKKIFGSFLNIFHRKK